MRKTPRETLEEPWWWWCCVWPLTRSGWWWLLLLLFVPFHQLPLSGNFWMWSRIFTPNKIIPEFLLLPSVTFIVFLQKFKRSLNSRPRCLLWEAKGHGWTNSAQCSQGYWPIDDKPCSSKRSRGKMCFSFCAGDTIPYSWKTKTKKQKNLPGALALHGFLHISIS